MDLARALLQRADQDELAVTAIPHLERMRAITGEPSACTCRWATLGCAWPSWSARQRCGRLRESAGPTRCTGRVGKILVAWSAERLEIVESAGGGIPPDEREKSLAELATVRKKRYAMSTGETIPARAPSRCRSSAPTTTSGGDQHHRALQPVDAAGDAGHLPELANEADSISEQLGHGGTEAPQRAGLRPS